MCLLFILFYNGPSQKQGLVLCLFCPRRRVKPQRHSAGLQKRRKKNLFKALQRPSSLLLWPVCVSVCTCVGKGRGNGEHAHVCVFHRSDIYPQPLFWRNGHLLGPVMTPAGRQQLRPGCTFPKESGPAARITRQICNKTLTSRARCPLASARTGAHSDPVGSHLALCPFPCAVGTHTLRETKGCLMSDGLRRCD